MARILVAGLAGVMVVAGTLTVTLAVIARSPERSRGTTKQSGCFCNGIASPAICGLAMTRSVLAPASNPDTFRAGKFKSLFARINKLTAQINALGSDQDLGAQREQKLAQIQQDLMEMPMALSATQIREYQKITGQFEPGKISALRKWFNRNTALPVCALLKGTQAWQMADGSVMNAAAHNRELFKVFEELAAGEFEAFLARHMEDIPEGERAAYRARVYDAFRQDFQRVAQDPQLLEILMVTTALHDYGKLLRGSNHPEDSARIAAPLLARLGYPPESEKARWILALIKMHVQMGGGLLLGESSPAVLRRGMQDAGITEPAQREQFIQLLSLLTFADIGSVGQGRYVPQNMALLRIAANSFPQDPGRFIKDWPRLRMLGLLGIPVVPADGSIADMDALEKQIQSIYSDEAHRSLLDPVSDYMEEMEDFLRQMEFGYARFTFGAQQAGSQAPMTSFNTMKFMTLADNLWRTGDKKIHHISFSSDLSEYGQNLNTVLGGLDFLQIKAVLAKYGSEIVRALEQNIPVSLWGVPVRLSADGRALTVDTKNIQTNFDKARAIAIGEEKFFTGPEITEEFRVSNHLKILRQMGYDVPENAGSDVGYDDKGLLTVQRSLAGPLSGLITCKFSNSRLAAVDGSVADLLVLLSEYSQIEEKVGMNALEQERMQVHETMRRLVFERLAKYREAAADKLDVVESYLDYAKEPSKAVHDAAMVAVNMLRGKAADGGRCLNIALCAYEGVPLIKQGGLGDVAGDLPWAFMNTLGHKGALFMPYWPVINQQKAGLSISDTGKSFMLDGREVRIHCARDGDAPIYLLECADSFDVTRRLGTVNGKAVEVTEDDIYRTKLDKDYADTVAHSPQRYNTHPLNIETAVFFSKAALLAMEQVGVRPDVVMSNDWETGLVPALIKKSKKFKGHLQDGDFFAQTKTVHTVHNLTFKGLAVASPQSVDGEERALWEMTELPDDAYSQSDMMSVVESSRHCHRRMSLQKAGLVYSDKIVTVSPNHAREIQTRQFGAALEELLQRKPPAGIINGIPDYWDPAMESHAAARFADRPSREDRELGVVDLPEGKRANKISLRAAWGLDSTVGDRMPVIAYMGRLEDQKGLDFLLSEVIRRDYPGEAPRTVCLAEHLILEKKAQFIFTGRGMEQYEDALEQLAEKYPGQLVYPGFVKESEVRGILAGADMLIMPSRYEPCGIMQLQAMRYGAVPIVSDVGGLHDTVRDFNDHSVLREERSGYAMDLQGSNPVRTLLDTLERALADYQDSTEWSNKIRQVCKKAKKFHWLDSAEDYVKVFRGLEGDPNGMLRIAYEKAARRAPMRPEDFDITPRELAMLDFSQSPVGPKAFARHEEEVILARVDKIADTEMIETIRQIDKDLREAMPDESRLYLMAPETTHTTILPLKSCSASPPLAAQELSDARSEFEEVMRETAPFTIRFTRLFITVTGAIVMGGYEDSGEIFRLKRRLNESIPATRAKPPEFAHVVLGRIIPDVDGNFHVTRQDMERLIKVVQKYDRTRIVQWDLKDVSLVESGRAMLSEIREEQRVPFGLPRPAQAGPQELTSSDNPFEVAA